MASIFPIISVLVVAAFGVLMLLTKADKNKLYVQFILLAYPFIQFAFNYRQLTLTIFDIITFLFFFILYRRKHGGVKGGTTYAILFMLVLLSSIVGCLNASSLEIYYTIRGFVSLGSIFIFAKILLEECSDDPLFFYVVIRCLRINLIFSLIFLVGQFIFGSGFTLAIEQNLNVLSQGIRYTSYFQDPQKYSEFLALQSFLLLIKDEKGKVTLLNYLLFCSSVIAILLTGGRAGFGGWAAGLLLVLMLGNASYRVAAIFAAVVLLVVVYSFADKLVIFQRSSLSDTYDYRYNIWLEALDIFYRHPVFGIGLGNYHNYISVHFPDQVWGIDPAGQPIYFDHPESGYLKFLTENGIVGFGAVMLILVMPVVKGFKLFVKYRDTAILFLLAGILSWMIGFYTLYSLGDIRVEVIVISVLCLLMTAHNRIIPVDAQ